MSMPTSTMPQLLHPCAKLLLGLCIFLASAAADAAEPTRDEAQRLTTTAEKSLDDWGGRREALDEARRLLDRAITLSPDHAEAYRQYARAHIRWSELDSAGREESLQRAEQALDRALLIDPEFGNAQSLRAHLYNLQQRPKDAAAALDEAERLGADDPWLPTIRADLFLQDDRYEEALSLCRKIRDENPDFRRLVANAEGCMKEALVRLDRLDEAEQLYQEPAEQTDATGEDISQHAYFLLCFRNQPDRAMKVADRALRRSDPHMSRLIYLASMYYAWAKLQNSGAETEAAEAWKQLERMPVEDPASVMHGTCGMDETGIEVLRALRDTHRAILVEPMIAVMAAAERAPKDFQAAFVMEVRSGAMVQGESFINSEQDYRDPRTLIARFTPDAVAAFVGRHGQTPDRYFAGKQVTIVGYAQKRRIDFTTDGEPTGKYYFQTQIKVTEPWQVEIYEPKGGAAEEIPAEIDV